MSKFQIQTTSYSTEQTDSISLSVPIGLFFNSSESRSLAYASVLGDLSINVAILIDFDGGENEQKKKNWVINYKALERISKKVISIRLDDIFDYQNNLNAIASSFLEYWNREDSSSVFMDISGVPLIYSTALCKFFFRLFPVLRVYLLNVSGRYASRGEKQFPEGEQYDMYIPGFYGTPDHSKQLHYVFLLGYDGDRSLSIYRDNLPDKVSVIIPSPGYDAGNDTNTIVNNREFLTENGFLIIDNKLPKNLSRNKNAYLIGISDINGVMQKIQEIYTEDCERYEIRLVPLGPKPHAIGAALSAVFNNEISIMYQVPRHYYMSEIPKGDYMWLYQVDVIE